VGEGSTVLVVGQGDEALITPLPTAFAVAPEWLPAAAEWIVGRRVSQDGIEQELSEAELNERKHIVGANRARVPQVVQESLFPTR
jgi:hypothetical protein